MANAFKEEQQRKRDDALSGAIVMFDPLAWPQPPVVLANPTAERGLDQVEPASLLRKPIESVIRDISSIDQGKNQDQNL